MHIKKKSTHFPYNAIIHQIFTLYNSYHPQTMIGKNNLTQITLNNVLLAHLRVAFIHHMGGPTKSLDGRRFTVD